MARTWQAVRYTTSLRHLISDRGDVQTVGNAFVGRLFAYIFWQQRPAEPAQHVTLPGGK